MRFVFQSGQRSGNYIPNAKSEKIISDCAITNFGLKSNAYSYIWFKCVLQRWYSFRCLYWEVLIYYILKCGPLLLVSSFFYFLLLTGWMRKKGLLWSISCAIVLNSFVVLWNF